MSGSEATAMIERLEEILQVLKDHPDQIDAMIFTYKTSDILPGFKSHVRRMGMGSVANQGKLIFNYITGIEDDLGVTITELADLAQD